MFRSPPRWSLGVFVCLAAFGCEDNAGGGDPTPVGQGGSAAGGDDMGPINVGGGIQTGGQSGGGAGGEETDALPLVDTGTAGAGGGGGDGGMRPPPGECEPGRQRCVQDGDPALEVCGDDARWGLDVCPDGAPCYDGRCLPSPVNCRPGERICISDSQAARCDPGVAWVPEDECAAGQICGNGECSTPACALATLNRSYLGCDYWAVELPNLSLRQIGGATPDAPVGVVVANADELAPAHLTVLGPDGDLANLVAQVRIQPPPPDPFGEQPNFQPETVRSEVRDSGGQVVEMNVAQADGLEIPPGGLATILLPRVSQYDDGSSVIARAFRLRTDSPIAAYQFNPFCCNYTYSNDASLLIPGSALGDDYRFLGVPAWSSDLQPGAPSPTGMAVVGTQDGTEVEIALPRGARIANDRGGRVRQAGGVLSVSLDAHEVAVLQSEGGGFGQPGPDFSGSAITANAPVAVFSTHQCSFYPQDKPACDHLEEQLFPTGTLGREYVLTPLVFRQRNPRPSEVVYWKVLATEADTRITFSVPFAQLNALPPGFAGVPDCEDFLEPDGTTLVLGQNGYCEFGTQRAVALNADKFIEVMGIVVGQNATNELSSFGDHAGDPAIFLLPPDQQYRDDYAFLVPGTYENDWLTVIADSDAAVELDGRPVDLAGADGVPGTPRVYKHIELNDGAHRITGDRPFGIIVYAFDDYVSYAFTGGLNLEKR